MSALRQAAAEVAVVPVDGPEIRISGLRVSFDVLRTADQEPNRGKVVIYNLGEKTRALISGTIRPSPLLLTRFDPDSPYKTGAELLESAALVAKRYQYAYVRLVAGFGVGGAPPIMREVLSGVSSRATSVQRGVDWLTTIEFADTVAARAHAAVNRTFERGEEIFGAVRHLVRLLGLRSGNVTPEAWRALSDDAESAAARRAKGAFAGSIFLGGGALAAEQHFTMPYSPQGDPAEQLTTLLTGYGVRWIVDEGAVWLLGPGGYIPGAPVDLGIPRARPEETEDGLLVEVVQNLLVRPGARVALTSESVQGIFFGQAVRHYGDTFGELLSTVEVTALTRIPGVV